MNNPKNQQAEKDFCQCEWEDIDEGWTEEIKYICGCEWREEKQVKWCQDCPNPSEENSSQTKKTEEITKDVTKVDEMPSEEKESKPAYQGYKNKPITKKWRKEFIEKFSWIEPGRRNWLIIREMEFISTLLKQERKTLRKKIKKLTVYHQGYEWDVYAKKDIDALLDSQDEKSR